MFNRPLVSIVTPVYNQESFVEETLCSVLGQTYEAIEFIVVNDGSTDGSRKIIQEFEGKLTIIDQTNSGQARALNRGWAEANGKYIGYLSSDDILEPTCVERMVGILESERGTVCAFPDCNLISSEGAILKREICRSFDLEALVVEQRCHIAAGALWRASSHKKVGGWKPELKLAPDREYWIRLAAHGRFHFVSEVLAGYRLHPHSISSTITSESVSLEYIRVLTDYFASNSVPPSIVARKSEAYANAYWAIAGNMMRQGSVSSAAQFISHAYATYPRSLNLHNLAVLVRTSIGKPLRQLKGSIQRMFRR